MMRFLASLLFVAAATCAQARCAGTDFRDHLSDAARAQLHRETAKIPFAYGNHWVATRDDRRIHVIGTMHVGDRRMNRIMRTLRPVVDQAELVLLEIAGEELQDFQTYLLQNRALFLLPANRTLQSMVSEESWRSLISVAAGYRMRTEVLNRLQPWALSMFMVEDGCAPRGPAVRRGLDTRIQDHARLRGIPVDSLETVQDALRALAAPSLESQARMMEFELATLMADIPDDSTAVEAYFDQAAQEALILNRWKMYGIVDSPRRVVDRHWSEFEKHLITNRNRSWLPRILAMPQKTMVVAVGAAHLAGRDGVLNQLHKRGFRLQRADF